MQNSISKRRRGHTGAAGRSQFRLILLLAFAGALIPSALFAQNDGFNHPELNWSTIETAHFFVHYHDGAERTARVVAKVAEDIYGPVTSLYNHEPDQKVSFVLKDYNDYSNGAAYFYDNKIEIWAPALDFDLRGTHNWLRNVVTHEFTHIIQIQASMKFGRRVPGIYLQWLGYESERRQDVLYGYPNVIVSYPISGFIVPSWFAEGVAQYNRPQLNYDYYDSHRDMILRMYALDGNMLSWSEMGVFGKTSLGNESSYNAGFALVKYISETYGADAIPKIAANLSRFSALTIDGAIERAIGKSGKQLYDEWRQQIVAQYTLRVDPIRKNKVEGEPIGSEGFGNFYPAFSPDGRKIAYTSTKTADYFGLSSLYIYDLETKKEEEIDEKVHSSLSWSPDGGRIYYSKITTDNPGWYSLSDIYEYDLDAKKEKRLTFALRALNPSVSPDGKKIVFAMEHDGTMNIGIVESDGKNYQRVTNFRNGEQVFTPKWSPDGSEVVFGWSLNEAQDVVRLTVADGKMETLIPGEDDARNPVYSPDGQRIYFVSDRTGIFNIYSYDVQAKHIDQITNVLGGAFMPSVNGIGDIAFASYTSGGFKLNLLRAASPQNFLSNEYLADASTTTAPSDTVGSGTGMDWAKLRSYDDTQLPTTESKRYKNIFTSLTIIPLLRIDKYSTTNKGIDYIKPGFYFVSSDVLDKYSIFGGVAMNRLFDRDLFFIFEYRGKAIGLSQLGLSPTISLEIYNVTRRGDDASFDLGLDHYEGIETKYGLLEFDLNAKEHLFGASDIVTVGYSYSVYTSEFGGFQVKGTPNSSPATTELYFKGNDVSLAWELKGIARSRDDEINPIGRKVSLKYDYESNRFVKTDSLGRSEYEASQTSGITLKLIPYNFHRVEMKYAEYLQLPFGKHTLSFSFRGGTIFGPEMPDYFDFYAGGLIGMRGYPFYALGGNEIAVANATYRFPVWENIDFRLLHIYFDKLYASVQYDFGNAWNGRPALKSFKKDVGFEFRLESYSFYAYPTRIFFNGTYGFDRFSLTHNNSTVHYGKEWRFYFGVLFGFDLD